MTIFLYGPDSYLRLQKKRWYIQEFEKKHGSSGIGRFDLSDAGAVDSLQMFLSHRSLFDPKKLAVIESAYETDAKRLKEMISPYAEDDFVHVLISEEKKPEKALGFLLKSPGMAKDFPTPKDEEWTAFIKTEAKERGVSLGAGVTEFLAQVYKGDSWRLATELDKIASRESRSVSIKDLELLGVEVSPDAWALIQGLKSYDMKTRTASLERLFASQESGAKVFNILSALWYEKMPHFAAYDGAIKSGKMDYEEALVALTL